MMIHIILNIYRTLVWMDIYMFLLLLMMIRWVVSASVAIGQCKERQRRGRGSPSFVCHKIERDNDTFWPQFVVILTLLSVVSIRNNTGRY
jgi:hypothetical protein